MNSAMPMSIALRRCPNAIVLPGDYRKYREYSDRVMQLFGEMTPLVERSRSTRRSSMSAVSTG